MIDDDQFVPGRGDVVWLSFTPQSGHEQAGRRPALILSPREYNERVGLAICCPITNQVKGYPFETPLPSGLAATGVVLADQPKSLDWVARKAEKITTVPEEVLDDVVAKIQALIG